MRHVVKTLQIPDINICAKNAVAEDKGFKEFLLMVS